MANEDTKQKVQTSELSKEVQIWASREKDSEKQMEILNKAPEEGKTVRQIRKEAKGTGQTRKKQIPPSNNQKFQEWNWRQKDGRFDLTIRFNQEH